MDQGISIRFHARFAHDLDADLPFEDYLDQVETEEGVLTSLREEHIGRMKISAILGPTLEADGDHHQYLILTKEKGAPVVTGIVLYPEELRGIF